jgi:hypothetical protein
MALVRLWGEGELHGVVEGELASCRQGALEVVAFEFRDSCCAGLSMSKPSAERRTDAVAFDRAP